MTTEDTRAHRWVTAYAERARLLRMARRRTASDAEAEDCVSEAMLRCVEFENLDESRLVAFLTTVTLRLCADQHRARARQLRAGGHLAGGLDEPSPEDDVCDRAEAVWLAGTLGGMSAHQRSILEARAEGLSCDQVARRLGVSVDAVKSAAARVRCVARSSMAKALGLWPSAYLRRPAETALVGGAFATAVAGLTVGGLLFAPSPPRATPPAAAPVVTQVVTRADVVAKAPAPVRMDAPVAARVRPLPARRVTARVIRSAPKVRDEYDPTLTTPDGSGLTHHDDDYTFQERTMHCVTEGVELRPTIRCKYPEGRRS